MKRRNRRNKCSAGGAFVFLGVGIVTVCIFPSEWMVVIMAALLVVVGIMLMKC